MNIRSYTVRAWFTLACAVIAWVGFFFLIQMTGDEEAARALLLNQTRDASAADVSAAQVHALANQTATQRGQLESMLQVDIVSVVDSIDALSKVVGIPVVVSTAQPENIPSVANANGLSVNAVGVIVTAKGSLPQIMHVVKLLEALPVPSSFEDVTIDQQSVATTPGGTDQWSLSARLRVLTTENISQ